MLSFFNSPIFDINLCTEIKKYIHMDEHLLVSSICADVGVEIDSILKEDPEWLDEFPDMNDILYKSGLLQVAVERCINTKNIEQLWFLLFPKVPIYLDVSKFLDAIAIAFINRYIPNKN